MIRKVLLPVLLMLLLCSGCWRAQTFSYKMTEPKDSSSGYKFYQPPAHNETLLNINDGQIRNIILCIGDGMGLNHVALTRHEALGPDNKLHMEQLPVVGIVRTYSANDLITDSAASSTAMACGVKTNNGMIGMTPDKTVHKSILELLQAKGWRSGLVATSEISHATPASFAAHVKSRNNQSEIAKQLLESRVDVLFGGGAKYWKDRPDGRNLFKEAAQAGYQVIHAKDQISTLNDAPTIGLFANEGLTTFDPEPSLSEMSQTAIQLLNSKGDDWFSPQPKFFLMIEGSQIDWAAHANDSDRVIRQTLLFDMAVKEAIEFAQQDKHTLVIVTSDHETGGLVIETDTLNKFKIDPDWEETGHTAADVPLYAFGPGSERFAGVMDNTEIAKRIAELTGIDTFPCIQQEPAISKHMSSD